VIRDEIHRLPGLFETLLGLIDHWRRKGHRPRQFLLEIDYTDFPCGFERLVALIQIRSVHKAGGSVLECSSAAVDMAEEMNPRLLLFNRIK
jgi:hypothetical protein